MIPLRPPSRLPDQDKGTGETWPRYEEVAQDGRIQLVGLVQGLTTTLFGSLLAKLPAMRVLRKRGILPILHRMVVETEERPLTLRRPIRHTGGYRFERESGGERMFLTMWLESFAQIGETQKKTPPEDAPYEPLGRLYSEQVLTKPFAPAAERKVTRLDVPDVAEPQDEHVFETGEMLLASGERAGTPLEDLGERRFGMMHTDPNSHVNSLVYPRIFEELAVTKFMQDAQIPDAHLLLARTMDVRWRKPFFAGERMRVSARRVEVDPGSGYKVAVVGGFYGDGPKPQTAVKMQFR